jgi:hypothetical protein
VHTGGTDPISVAGTQTLAGMGTRAGGLLLQKTASAVAGLTSRTLTTIINTQTTGTTTYASALFRKSTTGVATDGIKVGFRALNAGVQTERWAFGIDGNERGFMSVTSAVTSSTVLTANTTYLMVAKFVAGHVTDQQYLKIYKVGGPIVSQTEPGTWDVTITAQPTGLLLNNVAVQMDAGATGNMVDEIRVGTTWADVIPPNVNLLLDEPFQYSVGTVDGQGSTSRTGTVNSWAATSSGSLSIIGDSLLVPPTATMLSDNDGGAEEIRLADTLGLGGNITRYFSAVVRKAATTGTSNRNLEINGQDDSGNVRFGFGFSDNDHAFVNNMNAPNNNILSATTYPAGNTYLLAGKLVGSSVAASDQTLLKVYAADGITHQISPDAAEPVSWDVSLTTGNTGATLTRLFVISGVNVQSEINSIRIGYTWDSVISGLQTPVELSSFATE